MYRYIWHINKRPMGHIAHLRNSLNQLTQMNIIMLIKRRKKSLFTWLELNGSSFESTWIPLTPRMLVAKFGWNWPSGSGEENFFISSMYFCYFLIISTWKRTGPFIWTNLNPIHQRMLCAKFGWNWPRGSGEDENVKSLQTENNNNNNGQPTFDQKSSKIINQW